MDEDILKDVYKKFKTEIAINNFEDEIINQYPKRKHILGRYQTRKNMVAIICGCLILVSGVAFANNITKHFRGLGEGMDTAIQNGYIENPEMNFVNSEAIVLNTTNEIENIGTQIKIEDFIMDDTNLSTQFVFKFNNKINEIVDMKKISNIDVNDLIILDEENRIICAGNNKDRFENFCKENELNYSYGKCNDKYLNIGLNHFISNINVDDNTINLIYNIYSEKLPKSKKNIL